MQTEYIRRQDAVDTVIPAMVDGADAEIVEGLIYMIEPADVAPVVHAYWIDGYKRQTCSRCKCKGVRSWKYCPNCGAKMDGEE